MNDEYNGDERRDSSWHLSREVTVSTLFAIAVACIGGVSGYHSLKADVESTKVQLEQVKTQTANKISKESVEQLLENKDLQIQGVKDDVEQLQIQVEKVDLKLDANQALLLEIIRTMPRKEGR